eukprot:CAMPEP_0118927554 /NCGR_PEP_ID=MMETSP1169-20130426/4994_1 /TAXON_ID=36882 /ORGANISM="Pyramimonas obovata, Strain CCMP722" /LENGTH=441 /DNA_ID=CAMNT_0006869331 /DNA_START=224 /DNA_END=1549 /DNA_ORIENTATION=+
MAIYHTAMQPCIAQRVSHATASSPLVSAPRSPHHKPRHPRHPQHQGRYPRHANLVCRANRPQQNEKPTFWDPEEDSPSVERAGSATTTGEKAVGSARHVRVALAGTEPPIANHAQCKDIDETAAQVPLTSELEQLVVPTLAEIEEKSSSEVAKVRGLHSIVGGTEDGRRKPRVLEQPLMKAGPSTPATEYKLNFLERLALSFFHRVLAREVGEEYKGGGFAGMVRTARLLSSKFGSASKTKTLARNVFLGLLPPGFPKIFGAFCRILPDWFVTRHASVFTLLFLGWLVGPMKVNDTPEDVPLDEPDKKVPANLAVAMRAAVDPSTPLQEPGYKQGVLVERCRVLEESGCASVCLNVCKMPTQAFFTEEVGLPLTMVPNYETFECQFVFGATPPPADKDPAFDTPCFMQCPTARALANAQCHHLEWENGEGVPANGGAGGSA